MFSDYFFFNYRVYFKFTSSLNFLIIAEYRIYLIPENNFTARYLSLLIRVRRRTLGRFCDHHTACFVRKFWSGATLQNRTLQGTRRETSAPRRRQHALGQCSIPEQRLVRPLSAEPPAAAADAPAWSGAGRRPLSARCQRPAAAGRADEDG